MEVTINSREVAEAIAAQVGQTTGIDCEAFANESGSVVVFDGTTVIARVAQLFSVVDVSPIGGLFDGEIVSIPTEARTVNSIREIGAALDRAAAHVLNAAMHH